MKMTMSRVPPTPLPDLAVVVFGDGRLPELLLTCLQFRLVADHAARDRASHSHLLQLRGHIDRIHCLGCRSYLMGRLVERRTA